jgi:hypothetical protein
MERIPVPNVLTIAAMYEKFRRSSRWSRLAAGGLRSSLATTTLLRHARHNAHIDGNVAAQICTFIGNFSR